LSRPADVYLNATYPPKWQTPFLSPRFHGMGHAAVRTPPGSAALGVFDPCRWALSWVT